MTLSFIVSISKTLGPELEVLSLLNVSQRIDFLKNLLAKLISEKGPSKISHKSNIFFDSFDLSKHRRGLALQFRSTLIATPIFSPHNIVLGLPINQIDLSIILESSRLIWLSLGLDLAEFDFLLRKESLIVFNRFNKVNNCLFFPSEPKNLYESIRLLVYFEIKNFVEFENCLVFCDDLVVLKGESNLSLLETELGFFQRPVPDIPLDFFVSDYQLKDILIRAAIDQRKNHSLNIQNVFKRVGKNPNKHKNNLEFIKSKNFVTFK